ncbi:phage tail sheath subtilisin-like domain-containing protein [Cohnella fermenti]|uniref:Phage tail sheath protein n=1 Tax=Cohnella fermenti TaxID=2565925 RepID=A0A4S4BSN9_9BACL|nr:phage tail sheath subtilisin-like domain-containing protein [Cohnella fermenti]THF78028.1 phage tail sheath protein [Cohnella fermenti]
MAGGNWSTTDMPVLPGFYMAFKAAATAAVQAGTRGVVALPVRAHWGPVKQVTEIASESGAIEAFSELGEGGATAYTALRLALLGGASKVLAYRLSDGTDAAATAILKDTTATPVNVLKLTARYTGERGNAFKATVQENASDSSKKDLKLYEGATLLRTFTFAGDAIQAAVDAVNGDAANKWVTAEKLGEGNGVLASVIGAALDGGSSGIGGIDNADYQEAFAAFETQAFDAFALDGESEASLQASVLSWVSRIRSEGLGVIAVLGGSSGDDQAADAVAKATARSALFNSEGIVSVGVGAKEGDAVYSSAQLSAYVAGLIAGQSLSESTTYASAPFQDVSRRWTRSEQEQAVAGGVFLHVHDGRQVKALRGVNSLVSPGQGQSAAWKKIRTIRVLDAINSDLRRTAEDSYVGKVNNTEEGRLALIGACKQYLQSLAQSGVIEATGFDVYEDKSIAAEADQVFLKWEAKLTDVVEQIFGTFTVQ